MRSTVLSWRIMVVTSCLVAGCNKSPVPIVAVDPQSGELPLTVTCDGSGSYDPDGSIAGFTWDFGDGPINGGPSVSHEFTTDGSHQITLTVVDNKGKSAGSRVTVVVTRPTFAALRLTRIEGQLGPQNATQVYRADLSGVSTGLIASIIIYDNETGETGRMSGSYSGAAIDAVKISSLLCDQAAAVRSAPDTVPLAYTPDATAFAPGCQNEPTEFALYGTDATGFYLDNSQATLGAFDGMFQVPSGQPNGFICLGRRGAIAFNLPQPVAPENLHLYVGTVGPEVPILGAVSSVAMTAATLTPNPVRESRQGSCTEFDEYTKDHGVTDSKGVNHPGGSGWTHGELTYNFNYGTLRITTKTVTVSKYDCPCNHQQYDTLADCQRNCHINLGCFAGYCAPVDKQQERVCASLTSSLAIQFTGSTTVSILTWSPTGPVSDQCRRDIERYENEVLKHERRHQRDIRAAIDAANERLKGGISFQEEGCGATEDEAQKDLLRKLEQRAEQELSTIREAITNEGKAFDDSPEGQILLPQCDICS